MQEFKDEAWTVLFFALALVAVLIIWAVVCCPPEWWWGP